MFNGTPHLMEFGVDTLYNYEDQKKKAYAILNPGKLKLPPDPTMAEVPEIKGKIWVNDIRETKKLMFVNLWWDLSNKISNCIFDKSTSSFFILEENGFRNDLDGGMTFWPRKLINDNLMIDYADAFDLIKYSKEKVNKADKASSGQFGKVVAQLSETSNPVLIILKNK